MITHDPDRRGKTRSKDGEYRVGQGSLAGEVSRYFVILVTIRIFLILSSSSSSPPPLPLDNHHIPQIWMPDLQIDQAMEIRNPKYLNDASSFRLI